MTSSKKSPRPKFTILFSALLLILPSTLSAQLTMAERVTQLEKHLKAMQENSSQISNRLSKVEDRSVLVWESDGWTELKTGGKLEFKHGKKRKPLLVSVWVSDRADGSNPYLAEYNVVSSFVRNKMANTTAYQGQRISLPAANLVVVHAGINSSSATTPAGKLRPNTFIKVIAVFGPMVQ